MVAALSPTGLASPPTPVTGKRPPVTPTITTGSGTGAFRTTPPPTKPLANGVAAALGLPVGTLEAVCGVGITGMLGKPAGAAVGTLDGTCGGAPGTNCPTLGVTRGAAGTPDAPVGTAMGNGAGRSKVFISNCGPLCPVSRWRCVFARLASDTPVCRLAKASAAAAGLPLPVAFAKAD